MMIFFPNNVQSTVLRGRYFFYEFGWGQSAIRVTQKMILKSIKHSLAASRTCIHWHYLRKRKNNVKGVYVFIIRKTKVLSISCTCPRFNHCSQSPAQVEVTLVHYSTWCTYARTFPQLFVDFGAPAGPGADQALAGPWGHTSSVWMSSFFPLTLALTARSVCSPTVGSPPRVEAPYVLPLLRSPQPARGVPQEALRVHAMEERAECGQNSSSADPFCLISERAAVAGTGRPVRQILVV